MKYTTLLLSLLAFLSFAGCEDLEDTYDEYAGDGPVRYLAKSTDMTVESGWERLIVKWNNDLDPNRNNVRLRCSSDAFQLDTLLPGDCDSCSVNGLANGTYTVTLTAVSENGDTSLAVTASGRPYTADHEAVLSFTRGMTKYFFVKDRLVVFVGTKTAEIVDFKLHYTGTDGQPKEYDLSGNMWSYMARDLEIEGVDASQPVTLSRRGLLGTCPDTITFADFELDKDAVTMAADFQSRLIERQALPPHVVARKHGTLGAIRHTVNVGAILRVEARREPRRGMVDLAHRNVLRQECIHGTQPTLARNSELIGICRHADVLRHRMDASIGAASASDFNLATQKRLDSPAQLARHSVYAWLRLLGKTAVRTAIVAQAEHQRTCGINGILRRRIIQCCIFQDTMCMLSHECALQGLRHSKLLATKSAHAPRTFRNHHSRCTINSGTGLSSGHLVREANCRSKRPPL